MHEGGGRWVGSNKLVELKKKKEEENVQNQLRGTHMYYTCKQENESPTSSKNLPADNFNFI